MNNIQPDIETAKRLGGFVRISNERFGWVHYPDPSATWPNFAHRVTDPNTLNRLEEQERQIDNEDPLQD